MRVAGPAAHVSNLLLDEWLAQELGSADGEWVEQHLRACSLCSARRDQRVKAGEAFLSVAPSLTGHARLIGQRAMRRRMGASARLLSIVSAAAFAASVGVMMWPKPDLLAPAAQHAPGTARSKGAPHIGYYVKRGERVERGDARNPVRAGDLLRFTYSLDHPAYLALFDVDQRGARVYFPVGTELAATVAPGSDVALEFSVELDDTRGDERVYGVFCPRAFVLAPVLQRLPGSRGAPALPGCTIDQLVLRKAPAP